MDDGGGRARVGRREGTILWVVEVKDKKKGTSRWRALLNFGDYDQYIDFDELQPPEDSR